MDNKEHKSMDWLFTIFSQESWYFVVALVVIFGVFIYAARKEHLKHIERIKKIDQGYNIDFFN